MNKVALSLSSLYRNISNQIFYNMPYFIKFILLNFHAYAMKKTRYPKEFDNVLKNYIQIEYEEEYKFNQKKFNEQILENDFYKNKINTPIEEFPIINKQFIKNNYKKIINKKEIRTYLHTSGTTGSGLVFPVSKQFLLNQWAVFWKFRNIHGISLDTWCANIIGRAIINIENKKPPFWIKSYFTKQLLFSQYHLNDESIELYLRKILTSNIKWLHSYPSVLNNFASLIIKNNLYKLALELKLEVITTSSEKLFDYQRKNIENIFGCNVRELYGLTEGNVNIYECQVGTLHIDESYSYVELIQKNNSDEYEIIGTSYHNKAFPLIRYNTGDTCLLYDDTFKCSCGRKSRTVKEILGRDEDFLILKDGTKIGRLDHIFKEMVEVNEAQIFQKEAGRAIFKISKGKNYTDKSEMKLMNEIKEKLGKDFIYELEYMTSIPKTKSGKLKFVVSKVNE